MLRSRDMTGELTHWHYDTFQARFRDRDIPDALVTFTLDASGAVERMKMKATSTLADFSFDYQDLSFTPIRAKDAK